MTSQPPIDELSDGEYQQLLRREREKLDALRRRHNSGGNQYRLASLLIVVTLLAGFFAWMRLWDAEIRWSFTTGLTIFSIVFGLPAVVVRLIRSQFMLERSYFWTVLFGQLVVPTLALYGLFHSEPEAFARGALWFLVSIVVCVAIAGLLVELTSALRSRSEFHKAVYIGALWPLGMPPVIGIWIGLWRGDL